MVSEEKYQIAVNRVKVLTETVNNRDEQITDLKRKQAYTDKNIRDLCSSILANSPDEMVLGCDYSWDKLSTDEMIAKAIKAFPKYIDSLKQTMQGLLDVAGARRNAIADLENQLQIMMNSKGLSEEHVATLVEADKKKKADVKTSEGLPVDIREQYNKGKIVVEVEEDDFAGDSDMEFDAAIRKTENVKAKNRPTNKSAKANYGAKKKNQSTVLAHMVNLAEYEEKLSDTDWDVLETMGRTGFCRNRDILNALNSPQMNINKLMSSFATLNNVNFIKKTATKSPYTGNFAVYELNDTGRRVYVAKFGKEPKVSEKDRIISEHDNLEHGYGILETAIILKESGKYKSVTEYNRKRALPVRGGEYIPDIIVTTDNSKLYIEYERGNHNAENFGAKCEKMCQVSRNLDFLAPNKETALKLLEKVKSWAEKYGASRLKGYTVRIMSVSLLKTRDIDLNHTDNWQYVFRPETGEIQENR